MSPTDFLISEYKDLAKRNTEALEGIKDAIKSMNDTNILHTKAIENNTVAIEKINANWGKVLYIIIGALIILAGAEEVFKFMGI